MATEHGCRLKDPNAFQANSFRSMDRNHEGKPYRVVVGKLKGESAMTEQSYLYPTADWTAAAAKNHCTNHGGIAFETARERSNERGTIIDFSHTSTVADNEPAWGSVSKTTLPRLAFADQGTADQKSTWAYPHHWVENGGNEDANGVYTTGTMYLSRSGLNAAWSAAQGGRSGQEASAAVKAHLQAHRRALGMTDAGWYQFSAVSNDTAEVLLYEQIGASMWGDGTSAKQFVEELRALRGIKLLTVRLNSPGGSVFDGFTIYNALARFPARVETVIDGMALSIASVIALAGKTVRMAKNALYMIHDPQGMAMGTADDMRSMAGTLDKVKQNIVNTYQDKTLKPAPEIESLMQAETWFTAAEALAAGFIDEVTTDMAVENSFDLSRFKHPPAVLARGGLDQQQKIRLAHMQQRVRQLK